MGRVDQTLPAWVVGSGLWFKENALSLRPGGIGYRFLNKRPPSRPGLKRRSGEMIRSEEYKADLIEFLRERRKKRTGGKLGSKAFVQAKAVQIERVQDKLLAIPSKTLRARLLNREAKLEALTDRIESLGRFRKPSPMEIEEEIGNI